jgi:polyisoprenoid-binding protein YceI
VTKTLVLSVMLAAAAGVEAADFHFDASNSRLEFIGDYGGEAVPGIFKTFSGVAHFDLSAPLATRFETDIDIASLDTEYAERDDTLRASDFFDVEQYPRARWESSGDCVAQATQLQCPGNLTLRGVSHPVALTVSPNADGSELAGSATLDRSVFGVGSGDWADPETIAHAVQIRFILKASGAAN